MKKKMKKLTKKRVIMGGCLLAVVVIGAVVFGCIAKKKGVSAEGEKTGDILSVEVTTGTIETGVSGTGTLTYGDSVKITVPSDLEVEELKVSTGTSVTAGTLLATVDATSLATCLNEVQAAISDVDSTISSEKDSTENEYVKAGVAGRVKVIYAEADDKVADVMKEKGSLMVLSTDGYMAVDLENAKNLAAGDEVTVTDGETETSATVDSVTNDTAVILFADSKYDNEEELTVKDSEGNELGKAKAYIHEPLKVVGTNGTIASVNVSVGSSVSTSTKVFTLEETSKTPEYLQAVKEREQLVDLLATLIDIQSNGGIVAEADGVVESIGVSVETETTENSGSTSMTLGNIEENSVEDTVDMAEDTNLDTNEKAVAVLTEKQDSENEGITLSETAAARTDVSGMTFMTCLGTAGNEGSQNVDNSGEGTTAAGTDAAGTDAAGGNTTTESSTTTSENNNQTNQDDKNNTATEGTENNTAEQASTETKTNSSEKTTDSEQSKTTSTESSDKSSGNQNSGTPSGGGSSSKGTGSSSGSSSASTGTTSTSTDSSAIETVNIFEISSGETMKVTMTVDELDILSMEEGLEAQVTVDAIEGETFTGQITGVSGSASSSGETAQYSVEITFEKTDMMLAGMSASVEVILEKAENVLVVPLTAVTDHGRTSFVYTGKNDKDGTLTDEVEVELGISNETYVEIKSGLSQGDTIYYQMQGSEDSSSGNTMNGFGNFDKGMPNGNFNGEKPQRSEMQGGNGAPSGGSRGGQQ